MREECASAHSLAQLAALPARALPAKVGNLPIPASLPCPVPSFLRRQESSRRRKAPQTGRYAPRLPSSRAPLPSFPRSGNLPLSSPFPPATVISAQREPTPPTADIRPLRRPPPLPYAVPMTRALQPNVGRTVPAAVAPFWPHFALKWPRNAPIRPQIGPIARRSAGVNGAKRSQMEPLFYKEGRADAPGAPRCDRVAARRRRTCDQAAREDE